MELVENIPQITRRPAAHRSRVANGSKLLPLTDGRSASARRFKDLIEDIMLDLGGADMLSEGQRQLIRRAAMLSAESERLEARWARGESEFEIGAYATLTNALRRVLETLGLKRMPWPVNDGSGALVDYFSMPPPRGDVA
jgi:hypothetical protein